VSLLKPAWTGLLTHAHALQVQPCDQLAALALEAAGEAPHLEAPLVVEPSTLPAKLVPLYQGQVGRRPLLFAQVALQRPLHPRSALRLLCAAALIGPLGATPQELPSLAEPDAESGEPVALLAGVTAGTKVQGLAFRCLDEAGRPAAAGARGELRHPRPSLTSPCQPGQCRAACAAALATGRPGAPSADTQLPAPRPAPAGKLQVSWAKGHKKYALEEGADIPLPPLAAPDTVGVPLQAWFRCGVAWPPGSLAHWPPGRS
jgi:hypothetical protein